MVHGWRSWDGGVMSNIAMGILAASHVVPVTFSFTANTYTVGAATVFTFTSTAIGTAAADRLVEVGISSASGVAISTVTVGGVSAVYKATAGTGAGSLIELWQAAVPTGTTGDIVVTYGASNAKCGIGVAAVYGASATLSSVQTATNVDPFVLSVNSPANGLILGFCTEHTTSTKGFTWTNLTENFDVALDAATEHTAAGDTFAAAQSSLSVTCDPATALYGGGLIVGTWGPA